MSNAFRKEFGGTTPTRTYLRHDPDGPFQCGQAVFWDTVRRGYPTIRERCWIKEISCELAGDSYRTTYTVVRDSDGSSFTVTRTAPPDEVRKAYGHIAPGETGDGPCQREEEGP